jgi:flagellar protein FliL
MARKKKGEEVAEVPVDPETGEPLAPPKKKSKKKKLLLLVVLLAAGGGVYRFVLSSPEAAADPEAVVEEPAPEEGEILELPEAVMNLADPETRYARVGLALVLEKGVVAKDFEAQSAIAKDVALEYLSSFTHAELRDPATKQLAKDELSRRVRAAYGDEKVVRVLWTVLVIQ